MRAARERSVDVRAEPHLLIVTFIAVLLLLYMVYAVHHILQYISYTM